MHDMISTKVVMTDDGSDMIKSKVTMLGWHCTEANLLTCLAVDWDPKVGNLKLTQKQVNEIDETNFQHNQSTLSQFDPI